MHDNQGSEEPVKPKGFQETLPLRNFILAYPALSLLMSG